MRSNREYSFAARFIFLFLLLIIVLAVTACNQVRVVEKPVYVEKPVAISCVNSIPAQPFWETDKVQTNDSLDSVSKAYMIELLQRDAYEAELEAIVNTCAGIKK